MNVSKTKYRNLNHLLRVHRVNKGESFTHTSLIGGIYKIDNEIYKEFLMLYTIDLLQNTEMYLTEKHLEKSPLIIDFDFKVPNNKYLDKERLFKLEKIIEFCDSLIQFLESIIKSNNNFDYFILARPGKYLKKDIYKDGVHIIFPYLIIPNWLGYYIRLKMLTDLENILKTTDYEYMNDINDIYDESVIEKNNWMIFGSTKKDIFPYRIVYVKTNHRNLKDIFNNLIDKKNEIININTDNFNEENSILKGEINFTINKGDNIYNKFGVKKNDLLTMIELFSIRNKDMNEVINYHNENTEEDLLSEIQSLKILKLSKNNKQLSKKINREIDSINNEISKQERDAIYEFCQDVKNILIKEGNMELEKFDMNIDNIRKKIYGLDPHYFVRLNHPDPNIKMPCPFKGEPHNRDTCPIYLYIWKGGAVMKCNDDGPLCSGGRFPKNPIPIPMNIQNIIFNNVTIVNYNVNDDDSYLLEFEEDAEFIKIFPNDEYLNKLILNSLNGTHYDIAKVLYELYKDDFRCIGLEGKNNWYEFQNHKWVLGSIKLRQNISENLTKHYNNIKKEYLVNINNVSEVAKKEVMINNLIKKLKSTGFKNNIMSECCEIFYANNIGFVNKLDENKKLICFNNGVYDLVEMKFRDGRPEDCLSISTDYDHKNEYTEKKPELLDFIESIQPHFDEREYLLKFIASCFHGDNPEELFHIFTGRTRNGKSKLRDLLKNTFGNYYSSISSNLLTKERPSPNNPQTDIMGLKGKRIIIGSEPEKGQKINTGFMKFLTGNDPIKGRGLFEKNEYEYIPQFKVLLLCNDIPDMDSNDEGVWSRSRVVEFPITFVKEPKESYEKKIDTYLGNKLLYWNSDFFLLLMEYYKKYKEEGLLSTKRIMEFTYEYRKETDSYLSYLTERTEKKIGINILISDIYEDFKYWYKNNNPQEKIPSSHKFVQGIKKHLLIDKSVRVGKKVSTGVKNRCLKEDEENEDD
jgi:P4 family phage/plasmid primase-like protien